MAPRLLCPPSMREVTKPYRAADVIALPAKRNARYGEFDIIAPLARGGMGGVYLAVHHVTGERVALKVLDAQFAGHREIVERLVAEHALASRAQHPGIVDIRAA